MEVPTAQPCTGVNSTILTLPISPHPRLYPRSRPRGASTDDLVVVKVVVQVVVVVMVVKVALPDETDLRRARVHSAARWGSQICKSLAW